MLLQTKYPETDLVGMILPEFEEKSLEELKAWMEHTLVETFKHVVENSKTLHEESIIMSTIVIVLINKG